MVKLSSSIANEQFNSIDNLDHDNEKFNYKFLSLVETHMVEGTSRDGQILYDYYLVFSKPNKTIQLN